MTSNTWVLVADGARASVYSYYRREKKLEAVNDGTFEHVNLPSRDLVTTKRGRVFNSVGSGRAAMERPTDPHEYEKKQFAVELADFLKQHDDDFSRLIIAAAPKMLGNLRESLCEQSKAKIGYELDKDLTKAPHAELCARVEEVAAIMHRPS